MLTQGDAPSLGREVTSVDVFAYHGWRRVLLASCEETPGHPIIHSLSPSRRII